MQTIAGGGHTSVDSVSCKRDKCLQEVAGVTFSNSDSVPVPKFLNLVRSEISDFMPCAHAQGDILHIKHDEKLMIRAQGLVFK